MKKILLLLMISFTLSFSAISFAETLTSPPSQALNLQQKIDYVGGTNAIYVGKSSQGAATSAPVWSIEKITYDGNNNPTAIQLSPNYASFGDIWDNRASLSYS